MKKLVIIDDVFPHPLSGFRYQEFTSILEKIPDAVIYTNGRSVSCLGGETVDELIDDYIKKYPDFKGRVLKFEGKIPKNTGLLYCTFVGNAYMDILPVAEKNNIPFVFTLYPGGAFWIDNNESDMRLKAVCSSPLMEKVIVTQDITRNYLLEKQFVQEDKIKDVFGVVILLDKINGEYNEKLHYGIDKQTLDICFVAHRYTAIGQDKGYDIFIEAAKELSKKYNFVRFHVVGPWDESILDVSEIKNITFYGSRGQEWFDTFYKDKDIILSPNINGVISTGSFDGFPTGCVTDAALRKTAMLLTDPLRLNNGRFKEGEEIVVIRHDVKDILDKIEYYISEPEQLKKLCENGYKRVKEMYGYDLQIAPRINLLTDALKNAKNKRNRALLKHKLGVIYRRFVPSFIKNIYKKLKKTVKG